MKMQPKFFYRQIYQSHESRCNHAGLYPLRQDALDLTVLFPGNTFMHFSPVPYKLLALLLKSYERGHSGWAIDALVSARVTILHSWESLQICLSCPRLPLLSPFPFTSLSVGRRGDREIRFFSIATARSASSPSPPPPLSSLLSHGVSSLPSNLRQLSCLPSCVIGFLLLVCLRGCNPRC